MLLVLLVLLAVLKRVGVRGGLEEGNGAIPATQPHQVPTNGGEMGGDGGPCQGVQGCLPVPSGDGKRGRGGIGVTARGAPIATTTTTTREPLGGDECEVGEEGDLANEGSSPSSKGGVRGWRGKQGGHETMGSVPPPTTRMRSLRVV